MAHVRTVGAFGDEIDPTCIFVDVDDISDALEALGRVEGHHNLYDQDVAPALNTFIDEQVSFLGQFTYSVEPNDDGHYITVCPREPILQLFRLYEGVLAAERAANDARPAEPTPVTPTPAVPPPPPPMQRAGFTPEASPWAWLVVAGVVGGTWLYVRHDRKTRRR
jgi:hypothetical protein